MLGVFRRVLPPFSPGFLDISLPMRFSQNNKARGSPILSSFNPPSIPLFPPSRFVISLSQGIRGLGLRFQHLYLKSSTSWQRYSLCLPPLFDPPLTVPSFFFKMLQRQRFLHIDLSFQSRCSPLSLSCTSSCPSPAPPHTTPPFWTTPSRHSLVSSFLSQSRSLVKLFYGSRFGRTPFSIPRSLLPLD